jgi:hypothetical protein
MPSTSDDFVSIFIDPHKPIHQRTYKVNVADYDLVQQVFAEPGFLQYFPGAMFKILADHLKKEGINDFTKRRGITTNIQALLSHIRINGQKD